MVTRLEEQITKRVVDSREAIGLSRKEVASMLNLEEQSYGHYERGRSAFTVDQLFQLSRILGKPITYFLGVSDKLAPDEEEALHLYRSLTQERSRQLAIRTLRLYVDDERLLANGESSGDGSR